jgi:hypothetical protein
MSISKVESISINGSQNFLGGEIYDLKFARGFNGEPSTVVASIIAESKNYQRPALNYTSPYHIVIGNMFVFDFFAYKYSISDGTQGKIMTVTFKDGVNRLSRYWCAPVGQVCTHPNVIFIGYAPNSSSFGAVNQAQGVVQTSSFGSEPSASFIEGSNQKNIAFGSYNYTEFQAKTAFLGIPSIPSNNLVRITQEGTVLEIFNYFMNLYGYTWYMDNDKIKLIDLKRPVVLDSNLLSTLDAHPRRLNSNIEVSIENNYVRGAVALEDGKNEDPNDKNSGSFVLAAANAIWDGVDDAPSSASTAFFDLSLSNGKTSNANFLGRPLLAGYGPKAALYAIHSPQLYFMYIYKKFGLDAALQAMGLEVYAKVTLDKAPAAIKTAAVGNNKKIATEHAADVQVVVASQVSNDGISSYYELDKILGSILLQGYYTIQDINPSIQWQLGNPQFINPSTKISEIKELGGLVYGEQTLLNVSTKFTWLLSFPVSLQDQFSRFSQSFREGCNALFPQDATIAAAAFNKQYQAPKYRVFIVDETNIDTLTLPDLKYTVPSLKYINGSISSTDIRVGSPTQKDVPIYGLSNRKIIACNIPAVDPETSNLDIVTFENIQDTVPNVKDFIKQNTYSKNNPDVQFEVTIRGINLGQNLTPEQGLESFNISLSEAGYQTSYQLSSKREIPPKPEVLQKQFSTMT